MQEISYNQLVKKYLYLTPPVLWAILIWYLTTTPQVVVTTEPWFQSALMMFSHFSFFGVLSALLYLSRFATLDSIILTSLYGLIIEAYQLYIPGRSADVMDWILDTLGAFSFLFILKKIQSKQ